MLGVLAAQGDYAAHRRVFARLGAETRLVRKPTDLAGLGALVLPGGESTAMLHAIERDQLDAPLADYLARGGAVLATCAGTILLAQRVFAPPQRAFGGLDIDVERNSYGTQRDSFTAEVDPGSVFPGLLAVFIRAPRITRVGAAVAVLATVRGDPVLVRQGSVWAATFHPELAADDRVAAAWLQQLDRRGGA